MVDFNVQDKSKNIVIRNAKRGMIFIDPRVYYERTLGTVNFTIAHECFHWFYNVPYKVDTARERVNQELKDKFMELFQNGDDNMCNSLEQLIMDQVEKGIAVGREEGIAEGMERANIASAQKMLLGNMEISLIMEITNLKREKVEELRNEMIQSGQLKE